MKLYLTELEAIELYHKTDILNGEPDLQESYGISQEQATQLDDLASACYHKGPGFIDIPSWAYEAVRGEMADAVVILRDQAGDAETPKDRLECGRLAAALERKFSALPNTNA